MFWPLAGSKRSGRFVSEETMFREYLWPHCGWSLAETMGINSERQNKTRTKKPEKETLALDHPHGWLQLKQRLPKRLCFNTVSGWFICISGDGGFANGPTIFYLSSFNTTGCYSILYALGDYSPSEIFVSATTSVSASLARASLPFRPAWLLR